MENKIYLWKAGETVITHASLEEAARLDNLTRKPDKTISKQEYYNSGCLARVIDGDIFIGKTEAEWEELEKEAFLKVQKEQLKQIDEDANRAMRAVILALAEDAGVSIDLPDLAILKEHEKRAQDTRRELTKEATVKE